MAKNNFFEVDQKDKLNKEIKKRETMSIWVEKYRPMTLGSFVGNEHIKEKAKEYIENNDLPHLLFHGRAGGGKTTLAHILSKTINCDKKYINASDSNSVDDIRNQVKMFAASAGFNDLKILVLDEADFLTPNAQAALRNLMETFSATTRFILTCNYPEKIIDPIISRCQTFEMTPPSLSDVAVLMSNIFESEKVQYEDADLAFLVKSYYPDIRRIINTAQNHTTDGKFKLNQKEMIDADYKLKILDILKDANYTKSKAFKDIRQLLADNHISDFTDMYSMLYNNIDDYATGHLAAVIMILAEMSYKSSFVVDKEINFMSCILQLLNEIK